MFKRFQTRLTVTFIILTAAIITLILAAVYEATRQNVLSQIEDQMKHASEIFSKHLAAQALTLSNNSTILVSDYAFRQAIAVGDPKTSLSVIANLRSRIRADRVILIDLDKRVTADTGSRALAGSAFPFVSMLEAAYEDDLAESFVIMDDKLYEVVIVPVLAPEPIAWIAIALKIDRLLISELQDLSAIALEVSFLGGQLQPQPELLVSTLSVELGQELVRSHTEIEHPDIPASHKLYERRFITLTTPLKSAAESNAVSVVLQYPLDVALAPYQPLLYFLLALAAVSLMVVTLSGILLGRGVARPVRLLADAARRIEDGDYQSIVDVKQSDEIGQLAESFNRMSRSIAEREEHINYQVNHDLRTGWPNRHKLTTDTDRLLTNYDSDNDQLCLVLIGIKNYNDINNTLGHDVGDSVMKKIGQRLQHASKGNAQIARVASDAFAIVIPGTGLNDAKTIAKRLHSAFHEPCSNEDMNIDVLVEVGVSCYPQHAQDARQLIQKADVAMYVARKQGRRYTIYDAAIDSCNANRLSMMSELKSGLEDNQFQLYYQPKVNLVTGQTHHVEALIRWIHPLRGFMPPDDFIPLAEETGHIHFLTLWVLEQAIRQIATWRQKGIDLQVAVNLSARDLLNERLPEIISELLQTHQLESECLILEITESALMQDPKTAMDTMQLLSDMGIELSIDDFGTGYSSMAYLKDLPVDNLKIDKSFVLQLASNRDDETIVRSIIDLAHRMKMKVIAEGVENDASRARLIQFGCELAQGFYFSKPLPCAELEAWLYSSPWGQSDNKITPLPTPSRHI